LVQFDGYDDDDYKAPADLVAIDLGKDRRFEFAGISCRKFNRRSQLLRSIF